MKKVLIILIPAVIFSLSCANRPYKKVCIKDVCIKAEIADTESERQTGFMFRENLDKESALLFVFKQEGFYSFWMKNMRFPLDIIWISNDKRIVDIKKNVAPCGSACESLVSLARALYVLEVNSGFVSEHNIKIGQKIDF